MPSATPAAPAIFPALLAVQAGLDAIAKDRRVQEGPARFLFRGVDDVMNALHPLLAQHGVLVLPQVQERVPEARTTSRGGVMNVVHLRVRFTFTAADGSTTYAEAWGEGQDSGDKATGKAHSMAYKSAMLQVFSIPTEGDSVDDADRDTTPAASTEPPAHVRALRDDLAALAPDQAEWVRAHWPQGVPGVDRLTVSQVAQVREVLAQVPPPVPA